MNDTKEKKLTLPELANRCALYRVPAEFLIDLRHRVLRPGFPVETAYFEGDNVDTTWHMFLAYQENPGDPETSEFVSCASFVLNQKIANIPSYQLRGMATEPNHQGKNFDSLLLLKAEEHIAKVTGISFFWCNARVSAIRFYLNCGWEIDSDIFEIETVGPHRRMTKHLPL